jgi:hypothetical protein
VVATPLAEREAKMLEFLAAVLAQNQEIVPELAIQMGRTIRYGGEMRGFEERLRALTEMNEDALAPIVAPEKAGLSRSIKRNRLGSFSL